VLISKGSIYGLHVYGDMSVPQRRQDWTSFDEVNIPACTTHESGRLFATQARSREAEPTYKQALARCVKAFGPEHTFALDVGDYLGLLSRRRHTLYASWMNKSSVQGPMLALREDTSPQFIVHISRVWAHWGLPRPELVEHLGHIFLAARSLYDVVVDFVQQIVIS
jgi:hypothetical protein